VTNGLTVKSKPYEKLPVFRLRRGRFSVFSSRGNALEISVIESGAKKQPVVHCESKKCQIFHKIVQRHAEGVVESLSITSLLMQVIAKEFLQIDQRFAKLLQKYSGTIIDLQCSTTRFLFAPPRICSARHIYRICLFVYLSVVDYQRLSTAGLVSGWRFGLR